MAIPLFSSFHVRSQDQRLRKLSGFVPRKKRAMLPEPTLLVVPMETSSLACGRVATCWCATCEEINGFLVANRAR